MSKTARTMILGVFALSLAISVLYTKRLDLPSGRPWWAGRDPVVHLQVWEDDQELPTISMTIPKRTLDNVVGLGVRSALVFHDDSKIELQKIWHDLQRLPRGQKLSFEDDGGRMLIWIDLPEHAQSGHVTL
jgi:hypothetical protein